MVGIQTAGKIIGLKRGSHTLPRFIYHMTSKANYEKIISSGHIKPVQDGLFKTSAIFATDLTNLFKRWGKNPALGGESLQKRLLEQVAKDTDDIVILKIPTAKLVKEDIRLRNQNKFASWVLSKTFDKLVAESAKITNKIVSIEKDEKTWQKLFCNFVREHTPVKFQELVDGLPAKNRNLLKQRKIPFEYIYQREIPVCNFEKIGEVNLKAVKQSANFDTQHPIKSIFNVLLQGTPEHKATVMIKE